jgi:hypothetical protein
LPKKYLSRAQKRNKRKQENQFIESQKGAIHRFFSTPTSVDCDPSDNSVVDGTHDDGHEQNLIEGVLIESATGENMDGGEQNLNAENHVSDNDDGDGEESLLEIFDPRTRDKLDNKRRDILIEKGIMRELDLQFPIDNLGIHFSYTFYDRKLSNSEVIDRKWLVYSNHVDKVYYFCCRLFKSNETNTLLAHDGLRDWKHFSVRLHYNLLDLL